MTSWVSKLWYRFWTWQTSYVLQLWHYNDVMMDAMASQITSLAIVYSPLIQTQIKEHIKAPRHWPLCGEFTGDRWIPAQRTSNAENVSIWWRHHGITLLVRRRVGSGTVETPVNFRSVQNTLNINLMASIICDIFRYHILERGLRSLNGC